MHPRRSKVTFNSIEISREGVLTIETFNDSIGGRPSLLVEQLKLGRWQMVCEIQQKWNIRNNYEAKVNLLPGVNKFRVTTFPHLLPGAYSSDVLTVDSGISPVSYCLDSRYDELCFSDTAEYDLRSMEGWGISNGKKKCVDTSLLKNGKYQLFYDNESLVIEIKRKKRHRKTKVKNHQ